MIYVEKVKIHNFKCFENFEIYFKQSLNIIVGNNEEGKSTILEALHLALSGMYNGKYLGTDLSASIFNVNVVDSYISSLKNKQKEALPEILIEVFLNGDDIAALRGDGNSESSDAYGIRYRVCFNELYQNEYSAFVEQGDISTLPLEYYKVERTSFSRDPITNRSIPLKSVIIDSSSSKYQNGSDIYISKIIKDDLSETELTELSQSFRMLKEKFGANEAIKKINERISQKADLTDKQVSISVDMAERNSWDNILMTYIDKIPFHQIGKGEQCVIKTNLALSHQKAQTSNLILLEEPENHLSHTNLNVLLNHLIDKCSDKQLIVTTHSSYVANKLNLSNLILLSNKMPFHFSNLSDDDSRYFEKLPGYDTLRMILSKSSILVEGPSDELIIQKAFHDKYGVLPIERGIDVISVRGLSFKRFLSIADMTKSKIAVITDNDGNFAQKVQNKYSDFIGHSTIKVCADDRNELNTLEPQFVDANKDSLDNLRSVLGITLGKYPDSDAIVNYMTNHKSEWALSVFESDTKFQYPNYILEAIDWVYEGE